MKALRDRADYFAELLEAAMVGLGTSEEMLIRIFVGRCEIDLGNIKYEFERRYRRTLTSAIKVKLK